MRNLHSLKDIAVDAFESHNAKLKEEGKGGNLIKWLVHVFEH